MDELEKQQDEPSGETSVATKETSAVKVAERKGRSDALADVNRTLAEARKYSTAAEAAETRVKRMLTDYEESIRDDTDKLSEYRGQQAKRAAEAELAQKDLELTEANEKLRLIDEDKVKSTMERNAREVATRLEVDPERLIKMAFFTDKTTEAIEDIAKDLPKVNPSEPLVPDSNRAAGGSQSEEKIRENYRNNPNDPATREAYLEWRRSKGI